MQRIEEIYLYSIYMYNNKENKNTTKENINFIKFK